ncbi:unnamed protein product, partial [Meganyctiphanes norvegica]
GEPLSPNTNIPQSYLPPQHVMNDTSVNGEPTYIDLTRSLNYPPRSKPPPIPSPVSPPQPPPPSEPQEPERERDSQSRRKRKQRYARCRLCANHDKWVEVKGHKYYCPYRQENHDCEKCTFTRRRQFIMAEQQKITREQQQQIDQDSSQGLYSNHNSQQGNTDNLDNSNSNSNEAPCINPVIAEYPRLKEMVQETANIIKPDLLAMINQVVRHKPRH